MNSLKIICHGDSLTEGYEIDLSKRWTDQLQASIDGQIINSGISGDTTAGMLARFKPMVIDHNPTHVIIMGGTNDVSHRTPFELIISNIKTMTRQARHFGIASIIGVPTPIFTGSTLDQIHGPELMQEFEVEMQKYNLRLTQFAIDDGWPIIDFGKGMTTDLFLHDGVHPNEAGQRVMMRNALEVITSL